MGNELRSTETNVDNDLPHNLKSVFNKLNPQGHEACWPKAYQSTIKSIVNNWQELLHSLIDQDKENNTFMILYANQTSELLCKQNWDHDLWVLLCENMSEIITDEEKYQKVIQIITQSALQEQNRFAERSVTIASQLRVNPWYNLCKNILPLLIHKYQRCRVILLFIAIAAKEQHFLKQANLKEAFHEDEFMSLKSILMTDECWKNLCQVIELLEEKREILRNLSESVENGNLDISNIDNTLNENETRSPAQKDEDGPYGSDLKEREVKQEPGVVASTSNDSENIKIKQEIPSNFSETNEISILGDTNIQKKEPNEKAISPVVKNEKEDVYDSDLKEKGVNQKPTTNLGNIKIKEEYDEFSGTTTATSTTDIKVKQESNVTSSSTGSLTFTDEKDSKVIKKEDNFYKEEKKYDFTLFAPKVEVKTEGSSEDTASMPQGNQMQCTPNDKISQIKEKPSLEKLILDFSFQQLRHSTVTMNEDSINISDDDENCIEPEDNKLEVSQLLSMYQDILTDKSQNVLNPIALLSPLAEQKVAEENKVIENSKQSQRSDYISVTDVTDRSSMIASRQRIPSTSSKHSTQASKAMSSKKFKNQIKRSRSRTNASVKKLFEQLRNESLASITVESPLSTAENTVINLDETVTPKKRKASPNGSKKNKRTRYFNKKVDNDCIPIIQIEETNDSNTPRKPSTVISTSTPIANQNYIPLKKEITKPNNNQKFYEDVTTPQRFYEGLTTPEHLNEAITDLTKEINRDSYLTIDLTNESLNCSGISKAQNTVIDLDTTNDNADCSIISVSNNNLSISGESDVTVLHMSQTKKERQMRNFVKGISKLDATEKGKLLELITQNIFNGCNVVDKKNAGLKIPAVTATRATETAEDTYIKEVILGQAASRNSIGSNIYNPEKDVKHKSGLRMIVIDGSNVAMEHSRGSVFSVKALKICIDYFINRGHVVKAFVPRFRCKYGKSSEPRLLDELERRGLVIYTPSREIQGRMVTSYDDRYIVQCAAEFDGVIVSGDNYRDLLRENPRWRSVIETRVLPFTWVNDMIMFPRDPLGRTGPSLEQFLRHP